MCRRVIVVLVATGALAGALAASPTASAASCPQPQGRDFPPWGNRWYYDGIYVKRRHHLSCHAAANVAHHLDYDYYNRGSGGPTTGDQRTYSTQWGTFTCVVLDRGSDFLDGRCKGPKHRSVRWYSNKTVRDCAYSGSCSRVERAA